MSKRDRYKKSAIRSSDQALHPRGKSNELTRGTSVKKVTIKEEDDKRPSEKVVIIEESDEVSENEGAVTEKRSKSPEKGKSAVSISMSYKSKSEKRSPVPRISNENLAAKTKKEKLAEIK